MVGGTVVALGATVAGGAAEVGVPALLTLLLLLPQAARRTAATADALQTRTAARVVIHPLSLTRCYG